MNNDLNKLLKELKKKTEDRKHLGENKMQEMFPDRTLYKVPNSDRFLPFLDERTEVLEVDISDYAYKLELSSSYFPMPLPELLLNDELERLEELLG